MRILITGTSGFVGSAIASHLTSLGHETHGLSRTPARANCVTQDHLFDLRQPFTLPLLFDCVIHCAALSSPWAHPHDYLQSNVVATKNILAFCEQRNAPHFIFISSSSVHYQEKDQFHIKEDDALPEPSINEYARTKKMGEALVSAYKGPYTIVRPRAVYGPGDTVLFPRILRAAKRGRLPLIERKSGQPAMGDLIYIENVVAYIEKIVLTKTTGTYLLTNNSPININDFLLHALNQLGYPSPKRKLSVKTALFFAKMSEWLSAHLFSYREPPITQFGVSVFAYSKTFNVDKTIAHFGKPLYTNEQGLEKFIAWWTQHDH